MHPKRFSSTYIIPCLGKVARIANVTARILFSATRTDCSGRPVPGYSIISFIRIGHGWIQSGDGARTPFLEIHKWLLVSLDMLVRDTTEKQFSSPVLFLFIKTLSGPPPLDGVFWIRALQDLANLGVVDRTCFLNPSPRADPCILTSKHEFTLDQENCCSR